MTQNKPLKTAREIPGYRVRYPCQRLQVHYHGDVERAARSIPMEVYLAVIEHLRGRADMPVNIYYKVGDVRVHTAVEVLKCLGVVEEVGGPIDLTKPIATTPVALAVNAEKAVEMVFRLFSQGQKV